MVDEEELQFGEEYMNDQDPSILHFLLASGDDVCTICSRASFFIIQVNKDFCHCI